MGVGTDNAACHQFSRITFPRRLLRMIVQPEFANLIWDRIAIHVSFCWSYLE